MATFLSKFHILLVGLATVLYVFYVFRSLNSHIQALQSELRSLDIKIKQLVVSGAPTATCPISLDIPRDTVVADGLNINVSQEDSDEEADSDDDGDDGGIDIDVTEMLNSIKHIIGSQSNVEQPTDEDASLVFQLSNETGSSNAVDLDIKFIDTVGGSNVSPDLTELSDDQLMAMKNEDLKAFLKVRGVAVPKGSKEALVRKIRSTKQTHE